MRLLELSEVHSALLDILSEFDRVCREHHLRYTLSYGTLIGAVRHHGFIPWDDDVDVCMPRPDYEKFITLCNEGALGEPFSLSPDRGKRPDYSFAKVLDRRYSIKSTTHLEVPYLYVDVFPLDGVPSDEKAWKKLHRRERIRAFWLLLTKWYTIGKAGWLLYPIGLPFYLLSFCMGRKRLVAKMNRDALAFPFEESDLVAVHTWGTLKEVMPRETFERYVELDFAGRKFLAVEQYHEYLTHCYGDYMTPPPPNRQVTHHLKVYKE